MTSTRMSFAHKYIFPAARMVLAITFLYAAISKGSDFAEFVLQIRKSPLLEPFNPALVGWGTIALEVIAALLLSLSKTELVGFYTSFFLMLLFSAYVSVLYFAYPNAPCSCGGILGRMPYAVHIAFNIILTILAGLGIFLYKKKND